MKKRRKREYRYRDNAGGVTQRSLKRLFHLSKIGDLRYIRFVGWLNKHKVVQWAVIVRGTKGYARLEGFCFGYGGEGPHGLRKLFDYYRIPQSLALHIAHDIPSPDLWVGEHWRLSADGTNEKYEFTRRDKTGKVVEKKKSTTLFTDALEEQQQFLFH